MARRDIGTDDPRVRVRPARSKPRRSKKQVDYSTSPTAFVFAVDRGRIHVQMGQTKLVGVKARSLGRRGIVVGDQVRVTGDLSGKSGSLARIVEVLPRKTELTRSAEDSPGAKEKPMVANADQMAICTACADPLPRPGMIDRLLVAAYCSGIKPLLLVTKSDLTSPEPLLYWMVICFFLLSWFSAVRAELAGILRSACADPFSCRFRFRAAAVRAEFTAVLRSALAADPHHRLCAAAV